MWHCLPIRLTFTKAFLWSHIWMEPSSQPHATKFPSRLYVQLVGSAFLPCALRGLMILLCFLSSLMSHKRTEPSIAHVMNSCFCFGCQQPSLSMPTWPFFKVICKENNYFSVVLDNEWRESNLLLFWTCRLYTGRLWHIRARFCLRDRLFSPANYPIWLGCHRLLC